MNTIFKIFTCSLFLVLLMRCRSDQPTLLFSKKNTTALRRADPHLKEFTLLDINKAVLEGITKANQSALSLTIPYKDASIELDLIKVNLFDPSFVVRTDQGNVDYTPGLFYSGTVKGEPGSVVSISVVQGEVSGIISSPKTGDLNIGLSNKVESEYIIYNPQDAIDTIKFSCGTQEADPKELRMLKEVQKLVKKKTAGAINTCVTVDFEMAYSNFQQFGSVAAVTNWITAIFANVKTLYKNDGIDIAIKSIYVHTTPDGYDPNPATALNQLRTKRTGDPNFTGTVVHYVRGKTGGLSGIAYVGVACVEQYQYGLSDVLFSYAAYPAYSWTVMVISHELGHNLGSNHTQSCLWKSEGNPGWINGALDNCYTVEGSCAPGPAPVGGGTLMSYCHMTSYGISFTKGFGPQPGAAIRAHVGATTCANCSTPPPPGPTCTDGIKNGTETGIDCGGSCPPCPVTPPPSGDPLISKGKPISQSSNYNNTYYPATKANDGAVGGANFSCTNAELKPWIRIDLGSAFKVSRIVITNRVDCCGSRLKRFKVMVTAFPVLDYPVAGEVYYQDRPSTNGEVITVSNISASGRYVTLYCNNPTDDYLHVSEISVMGTTSTGIVCDTFKIVRDSIVCR